MVGVATSLSRHEETHVSGGSDEIDSVLAMTAIPVHAHAKHSNRTRSFFVPVSVVTTGTPAEYADHAIVLLDADGEYILVQFSVPADYVSGLAVAALVLPVTTGNAIVDVRVDWAAFGEAYNANEDYHADQTQAVTTDEVEKLALDIDFASPDTGSAPAKDEAVTVKLLQDTGVNLRVLGFFVEYVADM